MWPVTGDRWHVTNDTYLNISDIFGMSVTIFKRWEIQCLPYAEFIFIWLLQGTKIRCLKTGKPLIIINLDYFSWVSQYTTLPAQYGDSFDLKDGLLNNRVCTVKFPVVESYFFCNTKHTELHCTGLSIARKTLIWI